MGKNPQVSPRWRVFSFVRIKNYKYAQFSFKPY